MAAPVIYEIEIDTGEATGVVYAFCCEGCRTNWRAEECPSPGFEHRNGDSPESHRQIAWCSFCADSL